jgi:hypothetical protein
MEKSDRRAAVAAYKERTTPVGIFAVRCGASGEVWIKDSRHLDTQQNGIWFTLKMGNHREPAMQKAWNTHGPDTFSYEVLERLEIEPETTLYVQRTMLKERLAYWQAKFSAEG